MKMSDGCIDFLKHVAKIAAYSGEWIDFIKGSSSSE